VLGDCLSLPDVRSRPRRYWAFDLRRVPAWLRPGAHGEALRRRQGYPRRDASIAWRSGLFGGGSSKASRDLSGDELRDARLGREHGKGDPRIYEREVLPRIQEMTVPELMKLTGLSQFHCWKVRKGERRLHARHWAAVPG